MTVCGQMWKYVILATMMAAATQQARPHRQTEPSEGKFWWQTELEKIVHEPQPLKGPPVGELRVAKEPNGVDSSAEIEDESPPGTKRSSSKKQLSAGSSRSISIDSYGINRH